MTRYDLTLVKFTQFYSQLPEYEHKNDELCKIKKKKKRNKNAKKKKIALP